jgi:hypothetical protein
MQFWIAQSREPAGTTTNSILRLTMFLAKLDHDDGMDSLYFPKRGSCLHNGWHCWLARRGRWGRSLC